MAGKRSLEHRRELLHLDHVPVVHGGNDQFGRGLGKAAACERASTRPAFRKRFM
jgi:hypothetical protein